MILTELQTYYAPRLTPWALKRNLKITKSKIQKTVKARLKKAQRVSLAFLRRQYFLTSAFGDLHRAAGRNEDIVIASIIMVLVLGLGFAATVLQFVFLSLQTAYGIAVMTGVNMILLMAIVGGVLLVLCAWLAAFLLNMLSLAVMDGANRKVKRSIRTTARQGLRYSTRVANAWFVLGAIIMVPLLATSTLGYLYIDLFGSSAVKPEAFLPYVITAAAAWVLFALLHYSLIPQVALFEPKMPLRHVITRSRHLVRRHGRLFLLAGYGLLGGFLFTSYQLSKWVEKLFGLENILPFFMSAFVTVIFANSILVMLYRKRKLARKF